MENKVELDKKIIHGKFSFFSFFITGFFLFCFIFITCFCLKQKILEKII